MGAQQGERGTISESTDPSMDRQEIPGCSQEDMVPLKSVRKSTCAFLITVKTSEWMKINIAGNFRCTSNLK